MTLKPDEGTSALDRIARLREILAIAKLGYGREEVEAILKAMAEEYVSGSAWQPIETAPKDGTRVLIVSRLWCDGREPLVASYYSYNGLETWRDSEQDTYPDASCWQPLPEPPKP